MSPRTQSRMTAGERLARVLLLVLAVFFTVATLFALLVAFTLVYPGTPADELWAMKPGSRAGFESLGALAVLLMTVLAAVLVLAAIGLYRRRNWARWLAFALLVVNVVPDAVQALAGATVIFIPVVVVGAIAVYLALPVTGRVCLRRRDRLGSNA